MRREPPLQRMNPNPKLLEIPEQPTPSTEIEELKEKLKTGSKPRRKLLHAVRGQIRTVTLCLEDAIEQQHPARVIWGVVKQMDLSRFVDRVKTMEGEAGRPAIDPAILVAIWLYAYSRRVASGRAIEEMLEYEPGLMWLAGGQPISYKTLTEFRVRRQEELKELFKQVLAALAAEGVIKLRRVTQDGTRIRTQAGSGTLKKDEELKEAYEAASKLVEELAQADATHGEKERKAELEEAEKKKQQVNEALKHLEQMKEKNAAQTRVNVIEPEARKMRHGDGGYGLSYNAQITTDESKVIVAMRLTNNADDSGELKAAIEGLAEVREELSARLSQDKEANGNGDDGCAPVQWLADGAYTKKDNIELAEKEGIELIGPDPSKANEGRSKAALKRLRKAETSGVKSFAHIADTDRFHPRRQQQLVRIGQSIKHGSQYYRYQAPETVCGQCEYQSRCCPTGSTRRTVSVLQEKPVVRKFQQKMSEEKVQEIYKRRGEIAEFPHACIKSRMGLRKFSVRGMQKAETELRWVCLMYNIQVLVGARRAKEQPKVAA